MSYKEYKGNIFKEDTLLSNEYIIDKLYELDYCNEEIEKLQRQKEELQVNGLRQETLFKLEIERLNNLLKETSQTLSEQTTKAITLKSENERLNIIINRIKSIYSSLCFSAPENDYIFIEQLGEVLQELKGSD